MDYFTSDLHIFHKNVIKYEKRPFTDLDHMHIEIIKRWNKKVKKQDRVFLLGDIAFSNKELTEPIIRQLNGFKFLIMGNHDRGRSRQWFKDIGFDEVSEFPIVYKDFYFLSHEPMYLNEHMPYVNIHGHLHKNKMEGKQYINVGMDLCDFEPVSFNEIKKIIGNIDE